MFYGWAPPKGEEGCSGLHEALALQQRRKGRPFPKKPDPQMTREHKADGFRRLQAEGFEFRFKEMHTYGLYKSRSPQSEEGD